ESQLLNAFNGPHHHHQSQQQLDVVTESEAGGQPEAESKHAPVMATNSLKIWSNVDRFTGSLRNLRNRARSMLPFAKSTEQPLTSNESINPSERADNSTV